MRGIIVPLLLAFACGCGVKGDPVPPARPVEPGRGKPTFRRAIKQTGLNEKRIENSDEDELLEDDRDREEEELER